MNGSEIRCPKECILKLCIEGKELTTRCLVASILSGVDLLLGMDVVRCMGGVQISASGELSFMTQVSCVGLSHSKELLIEDQDFVAKFCEGRWLVSWKWKMEEEPSCYNKIPQYAVPSALQVSFDEEVQDWIDQGWLKPYTGSYKCLIPLMAVLQANKSKVRPVLDYRELNEHVSSHTGESVVCGEKLRKWRRMGHNLKLLDLRRAYLQLHVSEDLWKFQVTKFKGKTYCLTRLGFGLNVAPKVMTAVVNAVLSSDPDVMQGTDSYIDDIVVNENIVSCERVQSLLMNYGLQAKSPESLIGGRILGLRVFERDGEIRWRRDNELEDLKTKLD
jgi:hypothetical protein